MSASPHQLPLTFGFFTSTRGHFNRKTDWRVTLDHWDKQIPLSQFNLVAHLKVTPGDEALAAEMATNLTARGFHVLQTVGNWSRGLSHGAAYLGDQITMSKNLQVYDRPYFMLIEDDSPVLAHGQPLEDLLLQSCALLERNHELLTVRTIRRGDYYGGVPQLGDGVDGRAFYSPNCDFQPNVMRSLDFYRLGMELERNPDACARVQCERLWALILDGFSRSPLKHLVWKPDRAEAIHLGIQDQTSALAQLSS